MGRPRRNNRSTAAAATTIASTKTSGTTTRTKRSINEIQHHINDKDDADSTVFTTTTMMNDADENDDELRIYNEQIRYSEAIEFLQLQKERLERLEIHCSNQMKKKNTTTTTTTTTKSDPNYHIQLTRGMLYTLQQLQTESCTCLLCHGIFIQPITLVSCTHTFCKSCIHQHTDHSWYCPSTYFFKICGCVCVYTVVSLLISILHSLFHSYQLLHVTSPHRHQHTSKKFPRVNYQFL